MYQYRNIMYKLLSNPIIKTTTPSSSLPPSNLARQLHSIQIIKSSHKKRTPCQCEIRKLWPRARIDAKSPSIEHTKHLPGATPHNDAFALGGPHTACVVDVNPVRVSLAREAEDALVDREHGVVEIVGVDVGASGGGVALISQRNTAGRSAKAVGHVEGFLVW